MEQPNEDMQRFNSLLQKELEMERIKRMGYEAEMGQISAFNPVKEQNLIEYQLDLKEELDRIYHLLSGHITKVNEDGSEIWEEPNDDRLKIFSEYGVKQIMNIISFYVNRNTLMSCYDAKTILWKVRDFGIELSDLIHNRYEYFFYYPSPEELYDFYLELVRGNMDKYSNLTIVDSQGNRSIDERALYKRCINWSREEMQQKLRHYPMIILALIDTIHSTYLRALMGMERKSIRERINISQNASMDNQMSPQNKFKIYNPKTWE